MNKCAGVKVVLTASATEMSDFYNNPFVAFAGGFSKGPVPLWFLRKMLYPPVERTRDSRARFAPYGLRKVEALLLEDGFRESEVAVVHPQDLDAFVGPSTRVIGISSMDPTGMGYVSKTYSSLVGGGEPMNAIEFRQLVNRPSIHQYGPRVVVGGFGAWQLERKNVAEQYGVDCVVIGEGEKIVPEVFRKAVNGESLPRVVRIETDQEDDGAPLIRHAAIHGCVEISRGCGRNCQFCTPTMQKKRDVPLDKILKEVRTTVRGGSARITLVTEDIFLYGAKEKNFVPNKKAVLKLVREVAAVPGVKAIQPSHMSLAPIVHSPDMIRDVAETLIQYSWYTQGTKPIVTAETGIETGSIKLMKKFMAGKMLPFKPEQWKEVVAEAFGILNDNDWYPLATLIIGLPDEKEEDVIDTLTLLDDLKNFKAFYVPLFFVPLENCLLMNKQGVELDSLTKARWEFLARCWEYNVRIWRESFIEHRITNPMMYNLVNRFAIPFAGKVLGKYYGLKRGREMEAIVERLAAA